MIRHSDNRRTLLFLVRGDEILLAMKKRGFGVGKLNGVGGKIDPGETIEQAMVRECQEEIGVTPLTWQKVAEIDFIQSTGGPADFHHIGHVYITDSWEGEPVETEEMAPAWFNIASIPHHEMWDDDRYWLPQVLEGALIRARFNFDSDGKVVDHEVTEVGAFEDAAT